MDGNKKSAVKLGLYFGVIMGLIAGLLGVCLFPVFGCVIFADNIIPGLILGVILDIIAAVLFGILTGLIYGLMMYSFMKKKAQEFEPVRASFIAQKRLFYDGATNHMMGKEAVGGWMFLLNDTLYFTSHQQNIQVHELTIPLADIHKIACTKGGMRGLFASGLDIELMDGRIEQYVVNDRKIWTAKITEACHRVGNHISV